MPEKGKLRGYQTLSVSTEFWHARAPVYGPAEIGGAAVCRANDHRNRRELSGGFGIVPGRGILWNHMQMNGDIRIVFYEYLFRSIAATLQAIGTRELHTSGEAGLATLWRPAGQLRGL